MSSKEVWPRCADCGQRSADIDHLKRGNRSKVVRSVCGECHIKQVHKDFHGVRFTKRRVIPPPKTPSIFEVPEVYLGGIDQENPH